MASPIWNASNEGHHLLWHGGCSLSSYLFFCLSSPHSTLPSLFVSVSFCGLQSRSWSQPCRVPLLVCRAPGHLTPTLWHLESWGAPLSSTPGHLTSPLGLDGVTTPPPFPDKRIALLLSTRAALNCATLNDSLLLPKTQSAHLLCIIMYLNVPKWFLPVLYYSSL